jgi:hypothetical protein
MANQTLQTIEDLVTRARLGDQVASASLVVIGQQAAKGSKRAAEVKDLILKFIKAHPQEFETSTRFGIDTPAKDEVVGDACLLKEKLWTGDYSGGGLVVLLLTLGEYSLGVLTHGPSLLKEDGQPNPLVQCIRQSLASEKAVRAFDHGNKHSNNDEMLYRLASRMTPEEQKALQLGIIIGTARRFQAVSIPSVPLAILCKNTAWELGE